MPFGLLGFIVIFVISAVSTVIYIYKKRVGIYKAAIFFTFVAYLQCAYSLVILPFPVVFESVPISEWLRYVRVVPFAFVGDIIRGYKFFGSWAKTLKAESDAFLNILLTVPFGMYLRHFGKKLKTTVISAFGLSLFFEISQLTALFFIFPAPYRSFDVDDLITNTLGGLCGYGIYSLFNKLIKTR